MTDSLPPKSIAAPTEEPPVQANGIAYTFARIFWTTYFRLFHCIKFRGLHHIPRRGPAIFAPNHLSYYDPPATLIAIPGRVRSMAWEKLFVVPGLGGLIRNLGAYPVKLKSADKGAVTETLRILKHGERVLIFPEGERSWDGNLSEFEKGVGRVALSTGAMLVPTVLLGFYDAWPRTSKFPRLFTPVQVHFCKPIQVGRREPGMNAKERADEVLAELRQVISRKQAAWARLQKMKRK